MSDELVKREPSVVPREFITAPCPYCHGTAWLVMESGYSFDGHYLDDWSYRKLECEVCATSIEVTRFENGGMEGKFVVPLPDRQPARSRAKAMRERAEELWRNHHRA